MAEVNFSLLAVSFIAGLLTLLAPCVLPLLPIVFGQATIRKKKLWVLLISLGTSILLSTLILKVLIGWLSLNNNILTTISGILLIFLGVFYVFPEVWADISIKLKLQKSSELLNVTGKKEGFGADILTGALLGPVFSSCSPTFAAILAIVIPQSFLLGALNLLVYVIALCLGLLVVALLGQKLIRKLQWGLNPNGAFRKIIGVIFVLIGLAVVTGFDKYLAVEMLTNSGWQLLKFENGLLNSAK